MIAVILTLAWPTMLEQLLQTAVQYIDTAMVGALGTQATAAVGATSTVNWLVGISLQGLSVGFLAFISRACGAGEPLKARRASGQAVLVALVVGVLVMAATLSLSGEIPVWMQVDVEIRALASRYFFTLYTAILFRTMLIVFGTVLRAAGDTRTPLKVNAAVNLINVVLNFCFIYPTRTVVLLGKELLIPGMGWGVTGAAAASALAFTAGGIAITVALWRHPVVSPKGVGIRPDLQILRPCMKVALPNMLQRFGTSLGYVVFASLINSLGDVSTAAHTIANTVESAFFIPGYGMQTATATLIGNAYGAGDRKRMKDLSAMVIPMEAVLMILSGGCLFAAAPALVDIFSDSPDVISLGTTVLRMVALSEPFFGITIIVEGMMYGVGKTKQPLVYNVTCMWMVRILGTFICIHWLEMGLVSAWACMIAHNMVLFVLYMLTYLQGTWNPLREMAERVEKS
ncbi:MAG: MATE family efflux transporter [Ruminococcaceae bacterium]|nr:MATE family efflux transporter [Oscillospiraceae bacterium]